MGCPPKAQGRSGRAEQIQLQEVPGYSRHEPVEVQAQKFPTSQGRPWVEGGVRVGRGGRGLAGQSRTGGQENRGYRGCEKKRPNQCWAVAGRGAWKDSFLVPSGSTLLRSAANIGDGMKTGSCSLMLVLAMLSIMPASLVLLRFQCRCHGPRQS